MQRMVDQVRDEKASKDEVFNAYQFCEHEYMSKVQFQTFMKEFERGGSATDGEFRRIDDEIKALHDLIIGVNKT